jgi:hypothetical protein
MTRHDWAQQNPTTWYKSAIWLRRREHQLRIQPLCEECLSQGKVEPAQVADHHPPHKNNWQAFRLGPLRSLCLACHDHVARFHQHHGYRKDVGLDGWPVDRNHPVYGRKSSV